MTSLVADLDESATLFLNESIENALQANSGNEQRWTFALLHLLTALEHLLKARLAEIAIVLIRADVDRSGRSVGIETAISRLEDDQILGLKISIKDRKSIKSAIALRNGIAHGGPAGNLRALEAKYFELFSFIRDFFRFNFSEQITRRIEIERLRKLISLGQQLKEFRKRAAEGVAESEPCWECYDCLEEFVVLRDEEFICLFCHAEEPAAACERCSNVFPESETKDLEDLFDWDDDEGMMRLRDDFGISERAVCAECRDVIKVEVEDAWAERQAAEDAEYEYYMEEMRSREGQFP